jgi:hypothetical protein
MGSRFCSGIKHRGPALPRRKTPHVTIENRFYRKCRPPSGPSSQSAIFRMITSFINGLARDRAHGTDYAAASMTAQAAGHLTFR